MKIVNFLCEKINLSIYPSVVRFGTFLNSPLKEHLFRERHEKKPILFLHLEH